jgi:uncharacterized protein YhaN
MDGEWLSYAEAAERLNTTPEAVRQKAIRGRWQRTIANDGRARVRLPDGWPDGVRTGSERQERRTVRTGNERASDTSLIKALEQHVATLKEQLAAAEGKASEEANALREHNATLKADVDKLEALLAGDRERADKAIAAAEGRASEESAKTAQAIAAFQSLAERLEALAEAKRPPWWRRLVG